VPAIDSYEDVLSSNLREVWPVLAATVRRLKGSLVGGTALATQLRHRQSFDLDYMTTVSFSGRALLRKLQRSTSLPCESTVAETDYLEVNVNDVAVQIFSVLSRGTNPGHVKQLAAPTLIDGLSVASLPDLLAMKLDVIMYRPKLRDYIDIAAIDRSTILTIEDGLSLHAERYGVDIYGHDTRQIIRLLESPGKLQADRVFGTEAEEVLSYLQHRAREAANFLERRCNTCVRPQINRPVLRPIAVPGNTQTCNVWMPIAQARCQLQKGHRGHHRSQAK